MSTPAFSLPAPAAVILERLESAGYQAWTVGGCVRDSLLGLSPRDWDICTSATPAEMTAAFQGWTVIPTGLRHGTVTVRLEKENWEVTTFRVDGPYTDHRRPNSVQFVSQVEEDLSRRDFTVNAMAWHPRRGLLDPFGGAADLERRLLRCVGNPRLRFGEDALRILRGVRFAAWYGLVPEEATAAAIHQERDLLRRVAPERCMAELRRLLCAPGEQLEPILREFWDVLGVLPGLDFLLEMEGYDQQNPHHSLDLKEHTIAAVVLVPAREPLRFSALLHDGGKLRCRTIDEKGVAHYYGHPRASAQLAETALRRLRCENTLRRQVVDLVERHDMWTPPTLPSVRRWLGRLGEEALWDLLALQRGDTLAHAPDCQPPRLARLDEWEALLEEVLAEGDCFTLRDLAVNGKDLLAEGIPAGPEMGRALQHLLREVQEGRLVNEKNALLAAVKYAGPFQSPGNNKNLSINYPHTSNSWISSKEKERCTMTDTEKLFDSVEVLYHSSIRLHGSRTVYFDPFRVEGEPADADLILVTHDHFDHFSPADIAKVRKAGTVLVTPASTAGEAAKLGFGEHHTMAPGDRLELAGVTIEAVASYNTNKPNHPKKNGWVGYVLTMDGVRYYVAGDTDDIPEARAVRCDLALVPIGGTYTMTAAEAARMVNAMAPKAVVPTHYAAIVGTVADAQTFQAGLSKGILCRERMLRTGE